MTIRILPKVRGVNRPDNIKSGISVRARELWQPDIRASSNTDANVISIMGEIGYDYWTGEGVTAKSVSATLRGMGNEPVTVEINSPGGDFFEGLAIYNVLREHPSEVTVKVLGMAASAASVIAMAGDTIMVPRAGFIMIHNTWIVAMGNKSALRTAADWLEPFDAVAADVYAARTGLDLGEIVQLLDDESWIGGSDAVAKGFADKLLAADEVSTAKNEVATGPAAARRRLDAALAKGEHMPRSLRRQLLNEISGTPSAAEDGTPCAADTAIDEDGNARLRMAVARLKLARA